MTARRRKWVIVGMLALLTAAMGSWWVGRRGPEMRLELRFLGYTNEAVGRLISNPIETPGVSESAEGSPPPSTYALVLATNSGGVTLLLPVSYYAMHGDDARWRGDFVFSSAYNLPRVLQPGET